ncbi:MAG: MmcB family DNA repair protein [Alphaproteobacteria bacterium]|jgi:hypothetical protein|nr:MmcB family DNA repair protein [Alphaproteobacteria bacterium]MDP6622849.1 MmcB family DNA repair protein [Alphaproteobacteria bacterium]|tara:strand:+ start:80 stop:532 length:453 start_codon:yes stop_codon:yes gene_type:complete
MAQGKKNVEASGRLEARDLARGVCRAFLDMGYTPLIEFSLGNGRRVDVAAIDRRGKVAVAEVKASLADYRADGKWPEYLDHCDSFYFAVAADFPRAELPAEHGLMIADRFGADLARPAPQRQLNASRRRALTLRFARAAADRLHRFQDPG